MKFREESGWAWFFAVTIALIYLFLFMIVRNDMFFGDAISTISRAARNIYDSDFGRIAYPGGLDPGHPITFPLIYATIWKFFGMGLPQSHMVNFIFSILICRVVFIWMRFERDTATAGLTVLLLLAVPQFISNTAQMNTHLPLTFFGISLAYALHRNNTAGKIFFSAALLLTHLQGMYLLVPLWLWWLLKEDGTVGDKWKHLLSMLAIPILLFCMWLAYHYSISGWWISSPDYAGHRGMPGIKRIIINLILSDWRIVDYGQVALFLVPVFMLFKRRVTISWNHPLSLFLILYLFSALAISFTTQTGPAHRYLLPVLPFLVMANGFWLRDVQFGKWFVVVIVLFSGHFWFYPGKVMGDATLAYRDVFTCLKNIEKDHPNIVKHSYAPLSNASAYTRLNEDFHDYQPLYNVEADTVRYILKSNVSGDFKAEEIDQLQKTWSVYTYQHGNVYVELYTNPRFTSLPANRQRKVGRAERIMIELKHRIKGKNAH